jgi:hypothetical protein
MDKSEGRSFFSKTLSTVGDKVAKWYQTGNVKLSISSLRRARSEKVQILGNKVFELVSQGKPVTGDRVQEEYAAIVEIDEQIKLAARDLEKIQADGTVAEETEIKPRQRAPRKPKTDAAKADTKKTGKARKSTAATAEKVVKTEAAKKPRAKKASTEEKPKKKAPRAKKTNSAVPAVKVENKPAVRVENKPAVQAPAEAKPDTEA